MSDCQPGGMEEWPGQSTDGRQAPGRPAPHPAIERVACDRVSRLRQLHPNLMGLPGRDPHADKRDAAERLDLAKMRDRRAEPARSARHLLSRARVAADRALDRLFGLRRAPYEREVFLAD